MMRYSRMFLLVGALSYATGCRSISSTFMQRMDNDRLVGNSNGSTGLHDNAKPFKGIPVTMPVLTHVDISIEEEMFLDKETLALVKTERRNLSAKADPVYSDKIFAVDPKRAASGTSKYTFDMNSDGAPEDQQYFKQIKQNIDDETIRDINTALSGLLPKLFPTPSGVKSSVNSESSSNDFFYPIKRHVAWKRFDVSAPDFQMQVADFVNCHLNGCNQCTGPGCSTGACLTPESFSVHAEPTTTLYSETTSQ